MNETNFFKWALEVGGPVFTLAAMMFWFYRQDMAQMVAQWRGQAEMLVQVVTANTAAMQALKTGLDDIKADAKAAHARLADLEKG